MRKLLDGLYTTSGWLAGLCMIGVLIMVLSTIFSRLLGIHIPGTDAYAGYAMAGAGFLALASTLKKNEHIRVTLIITKFSGSARRGMEILTLAIASLISGFLAFYSCRLVTESMAYNDISTGIDATPMWIPQLLMAAGTIVFCIAFVDKLILELRGQRTHTDS